MVTQNNVKASITRGQEIPYTTTVAPPSAGGAQVIQPMPTVQFKTAALTLQVTPRITPADTILLQVDVDNGSAGEVQAERQHRDQHAARHDDRARAERRDDGDRRHHRVDRGTGPITGRRGWAGSRC